MMGREAHTHTHTHTHTHRERERERERGREKRGRYTDSGAHLIGQLTLRLGQPPFKFAPSLPGSPQCSTELQLSCLPSVLACAFDGQAPMLAHLYASARENAHLQTKTSAL